MTFEQTVSKVDLWQGRVPTHLLLEILAELVVHLKLLLELLKLLLLKVTALDGLV